VCWWLAPLMAHLHLSTCKLRSCCRSASKLCMFTAAVTHSMQLERALALRVTRLFVPDGCDSGGLGVGGSPQSSSFSIHTVVAADSAGGGTWVGAFEYSEPALLAIGMFPASNNSQLQFGAPNPQTFSISRQASAAALFCRSKCC
jgi:hypothetical protein